MNAEEQAGPLRGVRLLDLTSVVVGPYLTEQVGDLGAEVIKVESPEGDISRDIGPRRNPGMSAQFLNFNRNKRSVVLDLKTPEGTEALYRLAATCDAFAVNMRPQALERLKIDYGSIAAASPEIVYLRIVGFGAENPDQNKPAIDDVIQAASGVVYLQGELTGKPSYVGMAMADMTVALMGLSALIAGLYRRAVSGRGDEIEVRMYDSMAAFVLGTHLSGSIFEPPLGPPIYARSVAPNRRPFKTRDGALTVSPYSDKEWRRFYAAVGRPEIGEDPRFATVYERSRHLDELYMLVRPLLETQTTADWLEAFAVHDVPCSRVKSTADLIADPALEAAGLFTSLDHRTEGRLRLLNNPARFTNSGLGLRREPPVQGADTDAVLTEVGYSPAELAELKRKGVTGPGRKQAGASRS